MHKRSSSTEKTREPGSSTTQNTVLQIVLTMVVIVPILAFPSNAAMQGAANKAIQVMAALLAGLFIYQARNTPRAADIPDFLRTGPNLAVLLFLLSSVVSLLLGPSSHGVRMLGILQVQSLVAGVLLYFAMAYLIPRTGELIKIMDTLIWVGGLVALLGLNLQAMQYGDTRADVFGNSQLFGAFLMILLPMALVQSLTEHELKRKVTAQVAAAIIVIGMFMSGVRSTWISTLVVIVVLGGLSLIGSNRQQRRSNTRNQYLIPVLTLVACCIFIVAQGDAARLVMARLSSGDRSMYERQQYWYAARQLFWKKPILGNGPGTFAVLQQPYSHYGRPAEVVLRFGVSLGEIVHNLWLRIAAEQGAVGVLAFGAIIVTFLVAGIRRLREIPGGPQRSLLLACLAAVAGFSVDAITNPGWEYAQIAMFFWLILGLGTACIRLHPRMREMRSDGSQH